MIKKDELKNKILQAVKSSDIALLYTFEKDVNNIFDEEKISGFYSNILDLALENLTDTLHKHKLMDMKEVQDYASIKALYEYAIENYSAGNFNDASALFEVLAGLSNDNNFSHSLKFHWIASKEKISLNNFMEKIADIEKAGNSGKFYIDCFKEEANKLIIKEKNND